MKRIVPVAGLAVLSLVAVTGRLEAAKNLPPVACFNPSPRNGPEGTSFTLDASCSSDDKTPLDRLRFRWDVQNDGIWDTGFSTDTVLHTQYGGFGTMTVRLEVIDQAGLGSQATRDLLIFRNTTLGSVFGETSIDVSPIDPARLAVAANSAPAGTGEVVPYPALSSLDGGGQWTQSMGPAPLSVTDTNIKFDGQGDVLLSDLVTGDAPGLPRGVFVARSADGGVTYSSRSQAFDATTPVRFADGSTKMVCLNDSIPFDYPKLGADGSPSSDYRDNVYVVTRMKFDRNGDGQCEPSFFLAFRRAINHGTTWDEAFILTDDSGRTAGDFQNIAVAANGDVYMAEGAYSRLVCPSGFGAALRKSTDGGATFSAPACAYDAAANSAVDRTWTATDPSDPSRIWIAFTAVSFQPVLQRHILVVRSSDSGVTWSAAVRVDDVLPDDVVDHWHPALSVGGNGRLDLAWFDYRNSTPKTVSGQPGQPADIYYSWSTDGGLTWAPNVRLTPLAPAYNAPGNDYLGIASSGRRAYVAYAQDQDGIPNSEVHVATIEHTP